MLVTLEGLDGSGKTTAWEALREEGVAPEETVFTREPTDTWYGEAVARSIGDADADPLAELFLYTADHAAHLADVVRPALADGRAVVSDRYSDSRYAYQGATLADYEWSGGSGAGGSEGGGEEDGGRAGDGNGNGNGSRLGDPMDFVRRVHEPWTRPPDATIYLDVDAETAAERSGATNKFETASYLDDVRENYERLIAAEADRFHRVDATRPAEDVRATVGGIVADLLE